MFGVTDAGCRQSAVLAGSAPPRPGKASALCPEKQLSSSRAAGKLLIRDKHELAFAPHETRFTVRRGRVDLDVAVLSKRTGRPAATSIFVSDPWPFRQTLRLWLAPKTKLRPEPDCLHQSAAQGRKATTSGT